MSGKIRLRKSRGSQFLSEVTNTLRGLGDIEPQDMLAYIKAFHACKELVNVVSKLDHSQQQAVLEYARQLPAEQTVEGSEEQ